VRSLRIGTRGSALALWQAEHVADRLRAAHGGLHVELKVIRTKGDKIQDVPLAKVGGKGLFVKEIEEALLREEVDLAVHSMKDLPSELPPSLRIGAVVAREDPRDALVSHDGGLAQLPTGARVGTSSLRRRCQLLHLRPDLQILDLRGNVDTRIRKLDEGHFDAVALAASGLMRLGHAKRITELLAVDLVIPAVGQGALGIETRSADREVDDLVSSLHHQESAQQVAAERAFLRRLGGGCQVPVAAIARFELDELCIDGLIGHPRGTPLFRGTERGPRDRAADMGEQLAERLLAQGGDRILSEVYESA
jgi:hydroxymethylbilane synthase